MCYHILSQTGKVISISTEHWITNIELSPDEAKETFVKFDAEIHRRIKVDNCRYKRSKKVQNIGRTCWKKISNFEGFKRIFNNADIPEADDFTPEVLEDTYVGMDIALPSDAEYAEFSNVKNVCRMQMISQ